MEILKRYITEAKKILFEGNNYSEEWEKDAAKRGLENIRDTPHALDILLKKENIKLFERNHVFTEEEVHARYEIELEKYIKKVQIEGRILGELAMSQVVPAAIQYQNELITNLRGLKRSRHSGKKCKRTKANPGATQRSCE